MKARTKAKGQASYIIRSAFSDESNDGWVWICGPETKALKSRTVVKIRRPRYWWRRGLYVEMRRIDPNFVYRYNRDPHPDANDRRIKIILERDTLVMSEWYRHALGINDTTRHDNTTGAVPLIIKKVGIWWVGWRAVFAACQSPDPGIRLSTRLGVLGVWLGLLAVTDAVLKILESLDETLFRAINAFFGIRAEGEIARACDTMLIAFLVGIVCVWACWGPPRPHLATNSRGT